MTGAKERVDTPAICACCLSMLKHCLTTMAVRNGVLCTLAMIQNKKSTHNLHSDVSIVNSASLIQMGCLVF